MCRWIRSWAGRSCASAPVSRADWVRCTAFLLFRPQAVQNLLDLLRRDGVVEVVIHLHRRRPGARSDAFDFFQRDLSVGGDFLMSDSELLAGALPQHIPVV